MPMLTKRRWILIGTAIFLPATLLLFDAYRRSLDTEFQTRNALLQRMPLEASTVFYADLQQLRQSQFATAFSAWIPNVAADPEYSDFRQRTGFDFEHDLQQIALAVIGDEAASDGLLAVAHGHFDPRKLQAYAAQSGKQDTRGEFQVFSFALADGRRVSITFVNRSTLALTNTTDLASLLASHPGGSDLHEWNMRFDRLAGSPIFAVIRQSAAANKLQLPMPSGLQSPQLSALFDQLRWITIAARPQDSNLNVVAEGECGNEQTARQLADFLKGILVMAQAGLDTPQIRQQLAPAARNAYLELARTADVTRLDRGETKSVRVVFDITPRLLEAIRTAPSTLPASSHSQPAPQQVQNAPTHKRLVRSPKK